jgi:hypothetical protein
MRMRRKRDQESRHLEIKDCQTVRALHHVLDRKYREALRTAKADWQRLFAGADPSDLCVSVRTDHTASVSGFGWISHKKLVRSPNGKVPLPGFAR